VTARLVAVVCAAVCLTGAGYDDALRQARADAHARTMSAAVLQDGRLVWKGVAGRGARTSDVYSLASLTKTYIATLAVQRLPLGAPIRRWLAGRIPAGAGAVTVRELLNHTSGLPDYLDDPRIAAALQHPRHHWTESELLRAVRPPRDRGRFAYSNTNYVLVGAILRRADAGGVASLAAALGLHGTSIMRSARLARRVAGGHRLPNDVWGPLWTDGGVVATAADAGRFLSALVVERRVLAPGPLQDMLGPAGGGYGLGIYNVGLNGATYWGHDGSYGGWQSYALSSPETGRTFVVLAHGGGLAGPARGVQALADAGA
jgi:D-alanyl-D-alanine carboxypeptidase